MTGIKVRASREDRIFEVVNGILLAMAFVVIVYPLVFVLSASFSSPKAVASGEMLLLPKGVTLQGYRQIFQYQEIWTGYANTLFYTVLGTMINLFVTIPCGYALSRRDMPLRGALMVYFMITMYFNSGIIPHYLNVRSMGLLNTRTILLVGGAVSVYNLIVCRSFFGTSIPWALHEAARIDGASDARTFVDIVLPLSKPILVVIALYCAVAHWNSYFTAMVYIQDRKLFPLQLFLREILLKSQAATAMLSNTADAEAAMELYAQQEAANQIKYGVIVVSTLPMMMVYPWLQRFFAKGVMIGSVKG
ncbi:MAG: carbohydrate ABC transporter permease [Eubacteriales bacterium]|nr:carbohydrate ABC transporter permease [Eubacteriales bacterium]